MAKKKRSSPPANPIGMLYTTDEVAAILKQNVRTIQRLINDKKLPAYRIGRAFKIKESDLMKFLDKTRTIDDSEEEETT